jgi:hypothetical protein
MGTGGMGTATATGMDGVKLRREFSVAIGLKSTGGAGLFYCFATN